LPVLRAMSIF